MPNFPTPAGVYLPGYLNTVNSPSPSGATDVYGTTYPTGLTPGKIIQLAPNEAQFSAAPGTTLYDGAYQYVQLDSGATANNALAGSPAYIKLDSGTVTGSLPETSYNANVVTTSDQVAVGGASSLRAGVFINPASVNGVATGPTPGNFTFIFVGQGRVAASVVSNLGTPVVGDLVYFDSGANAGFTSQNISNSPTVNNLIMSLGYAVTVPNLSPAGTVVWVPNMLARGGNQGV